MIKPNREGVKNVSANGPTNGLTNQPTDRSLFQRCLRIEKSRNCFWICVAQPAAVDSAGFGGFHPFPPVASQLPFHPLPLDSFHQVNLLEPDWSIIRTGQSWVGLLQRSSYLVSSMVIYLVSPKIRCLSFYLRPSIHLASHLSISDTGVFPWIIGPQLCSITKACKQELLIRLKVLIIQAEWF